MEKVKTQEHSSLPFWAWVALNIADAVLTVVLIHKGGTEVNGLALLVGLPWFLVIKATLALLIGLALFKLRKDNILTALNMGMSVIVVWISLWVL